MKNFIFENGWNVEGFTTEEKALKEAKYFWDRLTDREKATVEYFRVYEISCDIDDTVDDTLNYIVRDIKNYKNPQLWYAVQTDPEDDWSYGSYDKNEALAMLNDNDEYTLVAVIENDVCIEEIYKEN